MKTKSFSINESYDPPVVNLDSPRDNSILKENFLSLKWNVETTKPIEGELTYNVYLSNSKEFETGPFSNVTLLNYLEISELATGIYYWKVVPFVNLIPGIESEVWSFRINPKVVIMDKIRPLLTDYYELSHERSNALAANMMNMLKDERLEQAVLVAGGFHTQNIMVKLVCERAGVEGKFCFL